MILAFALTLACIPGPAAAAPPSRRLALVPYPDRVAFRAGTVDLSRAWSVQVGGVHPDSSDLRAALLLVAEARTRGWNWQVGVATGRPCVQITTRPAPTGSHPIVAEQGYTLTANPGRITIQAASTTGRFYGVQTLRQLMRGDDDGRVPAVAIADAPTLAVRGVSDDVARGQMSTVEDFLAIVRELAFYKINLYQPYLESAFRFRSLPGSRATPALGPADLAAIVREGERYHVRVVPIVETLSHQEGVLSDPDHRALAEAPLVSARPILPAALTRLFGAAFPPHDEDLARPPAQGTATFCATDPAALQVVLGMVDDVAEVTTDPWFQVGGDECDAIATGRSAGAVRRRGFGAVYVDWYQSVRMHLERTYGRRSMMYADMALAHSDVLERLPRDVVLVDWHYDPADTFATLGTLRRAGFGDVLTSAGLWNWRTFYPHYARALPNLAHAADAARREHAVGTIAASWCDGGTESLREFNWPGYAYAAACDWEARSPDPDTVLRAYAPLRYGAAGAALGTVEQALASLPPPTHGWWGRAFHAPISVHVRTEAWRAQVQVLRQRMREATATLDVAGAHADSGRTELLRHAVARFLYLADREITLDRIARRVDGMPRRRDPQSALELRALADRLHRLTVDYARLWNRHDQPGTLADLERRLGDQEAALRALAARAAAGTLVIARPATARIP